MSGAVFEDLSLNTDRIYPQFTEAHEAVVTYSRVPVRKRTGGRAVAAHVEPRLDAAEIPLIDPHDDVDPAFAVQQPELRADAIDAALAEKGRRGGSMRVVVLGAAFAILAGVGVLAGTIGVATLIPGGSPADGGPAAETPLRLTSADAVSDEPAAVREIPLAAGEEAPAAEAVAAIAPPLPRPRPEVKAASLEPKAAMVAPQATASPEPDIAKAPDSKPAGSAGGDAAFPAAVSSEPQPQPQPQGTDALITSIEETLDKIDSAPSGAATANVAATPPAVLPPPPLDPLASAAPSIYPPVDDGCPPPGTGLDPCTDVMPPEPLTDNGYYQAGPVPPESVPYPYPPPGADSHGTFADGSASAGEEPESTTERRPGIVRRAITRTADAVGRVFSRDRDND
jgi:hypothetical protein